MKNIRSYITTSMGLITFIFAFFALMYDKVQVIGFAVIVVLGFALLGAKDEWFKQAFDAIIKKL